MKLTRRLGLVRYDAADEVRVRGVQGLHQVVQLLLSKRERSEVFGLHDE